MTKAERNAVNSYKKELIAQGTAIENKKQVALKGTIKEHSEYKGVKQTTLTRCKIALA